MIYVYDFNNTQYKVIDVTKNDTFKSVFVPEIFATGTGQKFIKLKCDPVILFAHRINQESEFDMIRWKIDVSRAETIRNISSKNQGYWRAQVLDV